MEEKETYSLYNNNNNRQYRALYVFTKPNSLIFQANWPLADTTLM